MSRAAPTAPPAEPEREPRYNLGSFAHQLVVYIPRPGETTPDEVREANVVVKGAYDRYQHAGSELHLAREELRRAPSLDRSADRAALAADKPLPPLEDRAEPHAKVAYAAAERKHEAAADSFAEAQYALAKTIHRHIDEWLPTQEAVVQDIREDIREMLKDLAGRCADLEAQEHILRGLSSFPPSGSLVGFRGFAGTPGSLSVTPIEQQIASTAKTLQQHKRTGGNFSDFCHMDATTLLAALRLITDV